MHEQYFRTIKGELILFNKDGPHEYVIYNKFQRHPLLSCHLNI
jgi:hypothetical protein